MSEVCLLKKEAQALSASKYVSVGNSSSYDPENSVAGELAPKIKIVNQLRKGGFAK